MRIKDPSAYEEEPMNLLSLIDMLFFLVVFFLVATQFKEEEREVGLQLPGLASSAPLSAAPQQLIINVKADGTAVVSGKPYDAAELEKLLVGVAKVGNRDILIRADERSLHKYFAGIASLCRKVGIGEVKIGYLLEEPKPDPVR
jgi:biopolymer transport protein ExbD